MLGRCAAILFGAALLVGCSSHYDPQPYEPQPAPTPNLRIADLQALYRGDCVEVCEPLVVRGVVSSSDEASNFYHTLVIEQQGSALELRVALDALHARYPVGVELTVALQGLSLEAYRGVLQVGPHNPDYAYPALGYLESQVVVDCHLYRGELRGEVEPLRLKVEELTREMCGRLVALEGMRYRPIEQESNSWSGYRRFVDQKGGVVHTTTSNYARFAEDPIQQASYTLVGILYYLSQGQHEGFLIQPRTLADLQVEEP